MLAIATWARVGHSSQLHHSNLPSFSQYTSRPLRREGCRLSNLPRTDQFQEDLTEPEILRAYLLIMQNGMVGVMWLQNTVTATCGHWRRRRRKVGQCGLDRIGHPLRPGECPSSSQHWGGRHQHPLCCYAALHGLILLQANTALGFYVGVYFVDNSGWWGNGGLFTALEMRSHEQKQYELAG